MILGQAARRLPLRQRLAEVRPHHRSALSPSRGASAEAVHVGPAVVQPASEPATCSGCLWPSLAEDRRSHTERRRPASTRSLAPGLSMRTLALGSTATLHQVVGRPSVSIHGAHCPVFTAPSARVGAEMQ